MEYRDVQGIAKETMAYIRTAVAPGMHLRELRRLCEEKMCRLGADSFWYWDIGAFVFAGDETAVSVSGREYVTSDRVIGADDIITVDLSPQHRDIWGDYARTIIIENGKIADDINRIRNAEWRSGLQTEEFLHRTLTEFAAPDTTFEALWQHMNRLITEAGFVNLDFMGNLGHSIVKRKDDRVYIEQGNRMPLSAVEMFTFEPHIGLPNSKYGYKTENIYRFAEGRLIEL